MEIGAGVELINALYEKLSCLGGPFTLEREEFSLTILPTDPNAYPVYVDDDLDEVIVTTCHWHAHFDDPREAGACAEALLTPFCRVIECVNDDGETRTFVERYTEQGWLRIGGSVSTTSTWSELSVRRRRIYQQNVLMPEDNIRESHPGIVLDANGLPPDSFFGMREVL